MRYCWLVVLFLIIMGIYVSHKSHGAYETNQITLAGKILTVEIAKTPNERERGLSGRKNLCSNCGLLFVFEQSGIYPFWMRRMYFDIDILWIANNRVVDITYRAKTPGKEDFDQPKTVYQSKMPIDRVLEVNAGWVEENGIKIGDRVKLDL